MLLHAKEGIEISGDPYEIEGVDDQFRGVTKLMFIMIFNAESRDNAWKAIKNNSKIKSIRNNKHPKGIKNFDQYLSLYRTQVFGYLSVLLLRIRRKTSVARFSHRWKCNAKNAERASSHNFACA